MNVRVSLEGCVCEKEREKGGEEEISLLFPKCSLVIAEALLKLILSCLCTRV